MMIHIFPVSWIWDYRVLFTSSCDSLCPLHGGCPGVWPACTGPADQCLQDGSNAGRFLVASEPSFCLDTQARRPTVHCLSPPGFSMETTNPTWLTMDSKILLSVHLFLSLQTAIIQMSEGQHLRQIFRGSGAKCKGWRDVSEKNPTECDWACA